MQEYTQHLDTLDDIEKQLKVECKYHKATEFVYAVQTHFIMPLYKMVIRCKEFGKVI